MMTIKYLLQQAAANKEKAAKLDAVLEQRMKPALKLKKNINACKSHI